VETVSARFACGHQYTTLEKATERQDVRAEQDVRTARKDPFAMVDPLRGCLFCRCDCVRSNLVCRELVWSII
jgi:hypothetical protein